MTPGQAKPERAIALGGAVRTVAGLTLVSRVLGLARDLITARAFLDSPVASAFAAAFALPNLFRRLFGEGALAAAFVPAYTRALDEDPDLARRLASLTVALVAGVTAIAVAVGEGVLLLLLLLLPEFGERGFSFVLMMLLLPYMPMVCATALLGGVLQVHGRFAPTAAAPVLLNLFMIAAAATHFFIDGADARSTATLVAVAALLAGLAQVAWSLLALRPHIRWTTRVVAARTAARDMLRRFVPAAVGLGAVQLNTFLDTLLAMWPVWVGPLFFGLTYPLDASSNGVLFFTQRLYQFPLGVFGIAVATAVFPLLARHARDPDAFADTLRRGIRLSLFIGAPASVGLALISEDLVRALFAGGGESVSFSAQGLATAEGVLVGYAAGVWAYALNHVLARGFFALGDTSTPTRVAAGMVLLNLALNLTLIWPMREAGLAWSTAACAGIQAALLAWLLRRRTERPLLDHADAAGIAWTILNAGVMGGSVWLVSVLLGPRDGWFDWAVAVAAQVGAGGGVYLALAVALKRPELRWLLARRASDRASR